MFKTEIIKVDPLNPDPEALRKAAEEIGKGGLVAFPTETVYGLGADVFNPMAVLRIFKAKERPPDNPLIVHIADIEQLDKLAKEIPYMAKKLMEKFWPGPLTIVLPKKELVPDEVTAGLTTVAVRMPAHPVSLQLIRLANRPIAAPSANLSGRPSPTSAKHVIDDLYGRVNCIIDGGETPFGVESTIIDVNRRPPILLRPGPLAPEDLEGIVGKMAISEAAIAERPYEGLAEAPGMKYRHYAPEAELILIEGGKVLKKVSETLKKLTAEGKKVGMLTYEEHRKMYPKGVFVISLGSIKNPYSIAHNLFSALRRFDEEVMDVIVAEGLPQRGIFFAVNNRLRKASSLIIKG